MGRPIPQMQYMFYRPFLIALALFCGLHTFAQTLSKKEKEAILSQTKAMLAKHYHFKQQVQPTISFLDKQWKAGAYDTISGRTGFTDALARDLKRAANDQHLNFFYTPAHLAKDPSLVQQMPWGLVEEKFLNNGLTGLQVLAGDVGYMRLQAFGAIEELLPAAFTFLANTQALIIDLRGNGGGMLSNMVSSYLLPEDSIHLVTIYWNDRTDSIYTRRHLPGPRYLNKPVYLLTDKGTFSSAEEFAYDLQALKRVTIVGEATGGGANPGGLMPIHTFPDSARIEMYVSLAHVEHALTKGNWEGKGVQPDVAVSAAQALKKAHLLAIESLRQKEENAVIKNQYGEIQKKVEKGDVL
jgi:retinol-binding protein 3